MESTCFGFEENESPLSNDGDSVPTTKFEKPPPTFRFMCKGKAAPKPALEKVEHVQLTEGNSISEQTFSPVLNAIVSITQVQELLLNDLNNSSQFESVLNSTTNNEISFYEDATENVPQVSPIRMPVKKGRSKKAIEKPIDDSVNTTNKRKRVPKKNAKANKDQFENENTELDETEYEKTTLKMPVRVFSKPVRNKKPLGEIQNYSDSAVNKSVVKPKNRVKKQTKAKIIENANNERLDKLAEQINSKFKEVDEFQLLVE